MYYSNNIGPTGSTCIACTSFDTNVYNCSAINTAIACRNSYFLNASKCYTEC